jgi:hypothetical protein
MLTTVMVIPLQYLWGKVFIKKSEHVLEAGRTIFGPMWMEAAQIYKTLTVQLFSGPCQDRGQSEHVKYQIPHKSS